MNNTSVTSFFHKLRNVTCHTYLDVCLLNAFIYKQTHTLFAYFQTKNLYITVYIYSVQVYMYFTSSLADIHTLTPPHTCRTSWPVTVAGLSIMIPPVKCDPAAWSRNECNGRREFEVSSDKWPTLAGAQQSWGLSDLSLHQQTRTQPLGLSAGCPTLSVFIKPAHTVFLLCFSPVLSLVIRGWNQREHCHSCPTSKTIIHNIPSLKFLAVRLLWYFMLSCVLISLQMFLIKTVHLVTNGEISPLDPLQVILGHQMIKLQSELNN